MNDTLRNDIASILVEAFGKKELTFSALSKALDGKLTSRTLCYKVMREMEATNLVVRTKVTNKAGKLVAGWKVNDADEDNAIGLYTKYLAD
jgi:DNA-binding HxlR family transcriptional regulator